MTKTEELYERLRQLKDNNPEMYRESVKQMRNILGPLLNESMRDEEAFHRLKKEEDKLKKASELFQEAEEEARTRDKIGKAFKDTLSVIIDIALA